MSRHIRHERLTREAVSSDAGIDNLPVTWCISWCAERVSMEWFFTSIDHAALAANGGIAACPRCVAKIVEALRKVQG